MSKSINEHYCESDGVVTSDSVVSSLYRRMVSGWGWHTGYGRPLATGLWPGLSPPTDPQHKEPPSVRSQTSGRADLVVILVSSDCLVPALICKQKLCSDLSFQILANLVIQRIYKNYCLSIACNENIVIVRVVWKVCYLYPFQDRANP